jgi:hypothetical protein
MKKIVPVRGDSKLKLNKETLRSLSTDELRNVAGAGTLKGGMCDSGAGGCASDHCTRQLAE